MADWKRVREVFEAALDRSPAARRAFVERACAPDSELRRRVETLLDAHEESGAFLEGPAQELTEPWPEASAPVSSTDELSTGAVLDGKYQIERLLGRGGMGAVYRATHLQLERPVALKVIRGDRLADSLTAVRFRREAVAVARLRHPNIVAVYDYGLARDAEAYIVMELLEGRSLRAELAARKRIEVAQALDLAGQICAGVAAAHRAGIVHRDLKPDNIFLETADGATAVKVLDFGLAKLALVPPGDPRTESGAVFGTALYMSPEQVRGAEVDAKTDVWSLGVTLYELLAGRPPFEGFHFAEIVAAILEREPAPVEDLAPGVPPALGAVVARALSKVPAERPSAAQLGAELGRIARGLGTASFRRTETTRRNRGPASEPERALRESRDERFPTAAEMADALEPSGEIGTATLPACVGVAAPTNLPERTSELIGRERELDEVTALVRSARTRLVTMTGPGGTGKTRLAVEAARLLLADFADGVYAVDLSTLSDPERIASYIAEVFRLKESPERSLADELERYLADKRLLLVLDNFEQLLSGAPYVARLLAAAPGLTALITSRAFLNLSAEREYAVEALAVPQFTSLSAVDELARAPAVALFVERARAVKPSFGLTAENARAVVEVCRRVEGLPLAIELAAARVKLLAPAAIAERLDRQLKVLTGGARDLPSRQQTMRGAVQWSYDLLEEPERALLRRLAVFAGGCTLEAAEAVCGGEELDVLDGLGSLADKSLLRQREQEDGESRFVILEVVREFALERLEAANETEAARLGHARFFLRLAEEAAPMVRGERQTEWLGRLWREVENLRAALALLLEREPEACARMALALGTFWRLRNLHTEAREWMTQALSAGAADPLLRAKLQTNLSGVEQILGNLRVASEHARTAVEAFRGLADPASLARALNNLGVCLSYHGDDRGAREAYEEGLAIARGLGDDIQTARFLCNLGEVARAQGDSRTARGYYEQALEVEGRHLRTEPKVVTLLNLGAVALDEGDTAGARAYYRESLAISSELGNALWNANALDGLAVAALEDGRADVTARLAGAAETIYERVDARREALEQAQRDRYVTRLREVLAPEALEREWARGRAMTMEDAIALALASSDR